MARSQAQVQDKHVANDVGSAETAPEPVTLVDLLRWRAGHQPDQCAYRFLLNGEAEAVELNYGELDAQARAIAARLQELGAGGERAMLLYPPGLDYVAAFFGCLYAGVVAIPAYPPDPARLNRTLPRFRAMVNDAEPVALLTTGPILALAQALFAQQPDFQGLHWLATDDLAGELAQEWQVPALSDESLAFLQYTSGSTATPKGVMVSHGNLLHNQRMIQEAFGHSGQDVIVGWLPMYHDMGLIGNVLQPLYLGVPCVLMSPLAFLQRPLRWLQAISFYRATTSGGPNFAYDLCVRKIGLEERKALDLSSWRVAFNGAEPVRPATLERFAAAFESCGFRRAAFYPCYGLAEATLIVSGGDAGSPPVLRAFDTAALEQKRVVPAGAQDEVARRLAGCGRTMRGQEIAIVDPEGLTRCPPDRVGEIWVAGPNVAQGYWQRAEETARTFGAHLAGTEAGPFLRTGDLGFVQDGELFIAGRIKDLIIIRGRNHYPHDVELTAEQSHPALRPGCGAAFAVDVAGAEQLVLVQEVRRAGPDLDVEKVAGTIRRAVAEDHELQVYAVVLIQPRSIAKTSSGKIQRHACRAAYLDGSLKEVGRSVLQDAVGDEGEARLSREVLLAERAEARQALLEASLRAQAARALRVAPAQVDVEQPLIALGLDSLMAVELQADIEIGLGVAVPAVNLLADWSIAQLAAQIVTQLTGDGDSPPPLPLQPVPRDGDLPLSLDQERLWFLEQLRPGNAAYHIPVVVRIEGRLDVTALEQGLNAIVARHESLRTRFANSEGRPLPVITPTLTLPLPLTDLSHVPESEQEAEVRRLALAEVQRPFDLAQGPLVRAALLRLRDACPGTQEQRAVHVIILTLHHIVADVWSADVLLRELAAHYAARVTGRPASLPELAVQYADFAHWQRQQHQQADLADTLAYWQERLASAPLLLELPADRPRPEMQSFQGGEEPFSLPASLMEALRELSRQEGVTPYMVLLAAFKALLGRWSGQTDLLVGTPVSGRARPETEALIGFFAYPLVLRSDLSGDPTFRELLARVRQVTLGAYAHQALPLSQVMELARPARNPAHHPLFQVMFGFLDRPLGVLEAAGLRFTPLTMGKGATDFDLFMSLFQDQEGLRGLLEYNADLFEAQTAVHLVRAYTDVLAQCIQHPATRLSQLALPGALEEQAKQARARQRQDTLAIAATFTAEPVEESLAFWMQKLNLPAQVVFAPYNQVFQQLLDPASLLSQNETGVNVVLVRFEDWQRFQDGDEANAAETIERNAQDLVAALKTAAGRSSMPYLMCVCPPAPDADASRLAFFQRLETRLTTELETVSGVYVVTSADLAALYPVAEYYDAYADKLGHVPYTARFFTALGTMIARRMYALRQPPRKVIVLDCDQTLWQGVCGEDGALGVQIDPPWRALQEFMVAQHEAGKLLCLCSKNNEEDVWEVFARRKEMALRREHLVAWRVNWRPKSENLRALAEELQLGLDSFILLDDNPVECAEVQANCPEVLTLQLPQEPARLARFLQHVWVFDHLKVTDEDRQRTVFYQQNLARERLQQQALTFEAFLESLELEVQIGALTPSQLPRVAQLTQRTNQFNVTTIRRSERELQQLCESGHECLAVQVRDRFGNYGLVGLMLFEVKAGAIRVDTFLLSCRTLGRGVEHRMLARLGEIAQARSLDRVEVPFVPTKKNQPALDFLETVGGAFKRSQDGGLLFRLPAQLTATFKPVQGR